MEQPERQVNRKTKTAGTQTPFVTVLLHCILIIASPIVSFFTSKYFIFDTLDLTVIQSNIWAAVVAVVALHLALGLFLYRAYSEVDPREISQKQD